MNLRIVFMFYIILLSFSFLFNLIKKSLIKTLCTFNFSIVKLKNTILNILIGIFSIIKKLVFNKKRNA